MVWGMYFRGFLAVLVASCLASFAQSQESPLKKLDLKPRLLKPLGGLRGEGKVTLSAEFRVLPGTSEGRLEVTAEITPLWHIYSLTQPAGGPTPSKLTISPSADFEITGQFTADPPPHVKPPDIFKVNIEEHDDEVTWTAPIRLREGVSPEGLVISGTYDGQICADGGVCIPLDDLPFTANFAGAAVAKEPVAIDGAKAYRPEGSHVDVIGGVEPSVVKPGGTVRLKITATPEKPYHVYGWAPRVPVGAISQPTLIVVTAPADWKASEAKLSVAAKVHKVEGLPDAWWHDTAVQWTVEIAVPANAAAGEVDLSGALGIQTCTPALCDSPSGATFAAKIKVDPAAGADSLPAVLAFDAAPYSIAKKAAAAMGVEEKPATNAAPGSAAAPPSKLDTSKIRVQNDTANLPLWRILPLAFLGGFLLNFMPCVLPVIGLKVLSFVEQAGHNRARILALNITYAAGMLAVFLLLATLAVVFKLRWGEQFGIDAFNIPLAAIVFAMALSFLGVWEIPIPGFVGTGKTQELARREGLSGAFTKGAITTVLATPCTGPGMATALAWSAAQPPALTYLVFTLLGLGMASPYLVIGAYPNLLRWLPKPGAWMETFKQLMGFVLIATVVFMFTFIRSTSVVPLLAMLGGISMACWWIGRIDFTAEFQVKLRTWLLASTLVAASGWFSFGWLAGVMEQRFVIAVDREIGRRGNENTTAVKPAHSEHELPWQPYSLAELEKHTSQNRTVLVDFTADWCVNCKTLEGFVLNTEVVRDHVRQAGVITLVADWTKRPAEITNMLTALGSAGVPTLAIFPAGRPNEPLVFTDPYTQAALMEKLREAGPSAGERVARAQQ